MSEDENVQNHSLLSSAKNDTSTNTTKGLQRWIDALDKNG